MQTDLETFLDELALSLASGALSEFSALDRWLLGRAMEHVGMLCYPPVAGDPDGERASGSVICDRCGLIYGAHPLDWRVVGYAHRPFLNVLCDGRRVKL